MQEAFEEFMKEQVSFLTERTQERIDDILEKKSNLSVYEVTGLIPEKKLMDAYDISYSTLAKWREYGLQRYKPYKDARQYFYKIKDIIEFMKVED